MTRSKEALLYYSQSESETESEEEEKERVLRCNYVHQTKKEFKKNLLMSGYEGETALSAEASTLENRCQTQLSRGPEVLRGEGLFHVLFCLPGPAALSRTFRIKVKCYKCE